ncbi:hypothetical protein K439DRAFT_1610458 [Ramaria rubella]|nr:hypothetical protein K439DRAFT_1610458 [Ramaria rubella]
MSTAFLIPVVHHLAQTTLPKTLRMDCEAALKNGAASGPIDFSSLNSSYLATFLLPATYTIMLYDYFLTFGLEIRFVWSSKWSLAKALYFATTYINLTNTIVSAPGTFGPCSSIPGIFATLEVSVLLFRTWVIWERNKNMAIGLLGLLAFVAIPSTTFMVLGIRAGE